MAPPSVEFEHVALNQKTIPEDTHFEDDPFLEKADLQPYSAAASSKKAKAAAAAGAAASQFSTTSEDKHPKKKSYSSSSSSSTASFRRRPRAIVEIPFQLDQEERSMSFARNSRMTLLSSSSSIPFYGNSLQCSVQGSTVLRGRTGYTTGSFHGTWKPPLFYNHHHNFELASGATVGASKVPSVYVTARTHVVVTGSTTTTTTSSSSSTTTTTTTTTRKTTLAATLKNMNDKNQPKPVFNLAAHTHALHPNVSFRSECTVDLMMTPTTATTSTSTTSTSTSSSPLRTLLVASFHNAAATNQNKLSNPTKDNNTTKWNFQLGWNNRHPFASFQLAPSLSSLHSWFQKRSKPKNSILNLDLTASYKPTTETASMGAYWTRKFYAPTTKKKKNNNSPYRVIGIGLVWNQFMTIISANAANRKSDHPVSTSSTNTTTTTSSNWSFVFSWTQGDLTIRVPITTTAIAATEMTWKTLAMNTLILNVMARFIQDFVGHFLGVEQQQPQEQQEHEFSNRSSTATTTTTITKEREEALQQQRFMERQAKIRMQRERENNGLVITKAIYSFPGLDDDDEELLLSLDVTIPLQFWVTQSQLQITSTDKSHLLGFYDITKHSSNKKHNKKDNDSSNSSSSSHGPSESFMDDDTVVHSNKKPSVWSQITKYIFSFSKSTTRTTSETQSNRQQQQQQQVVVIVPAQEEQQQQQQAQLTVWYDFGGHSYHISIDNDQELSLPSPNASQLTPTSQQPLQRQR